MRSLTHPSDYFLHKILASWKLVISAVYFVCLWLSCSRCLFTQLNTHKKFWDFFVPIHDYAQHSGLKSKRCLHTLKSTCKVRSEFSSSTDCFRDIKKREFKAPFVLNWYQNFNRCCILPVWISGNALKLLRQIWSS